MKKLIKTISVLFLLVFALTACFQIPSGMSSDDIKNTVEAKVATEMSQRFPTAIPAVPTAAPAATPVVIMVYAPTNTPLPALPTYTPYPLPTPSTQPCNWASLVSENEHDGAIKTPGQNFTHTWTLINKGNCTWNQNYTLVYDHGNSQMGAGTQITFPYYNVPYGQTATLTLSNLFAPTSPGNYTSYWKLVSDSGYSFGQIWVNIVVNGGANLQITVGTFMVTNTGGFHPCVVSVPITSSTVGVVRNHWIITYNQPPLFPPLNLFTVNVPIPNLTFSVPGSTQYVTWTSPDVSTPPYSGFAYPNTITVTLFNEIPNNQPFGPVTFICS